MVLEQTSLDCGKHCKRWEGTSGSWFEAREVKQGQVIQRRNEPWKEQKRCQPASIKRPITYQFGVHWVWAHNLTMHALGILFNDSYGLAYLTKLVMVFFFMFIFTFHIHIHFRGGFLFHIHWFSYIFAFYINLLRKGYHWNN